MFEPFGVGEVGEEVDQAEGEKAWAEEKGGGEGEEEEEEGRTPGDADGKGARGDGAVAFFRVLAVGFYVGQIVDEVDDAGEQAEDSYASQGGEEGGEIGQFAVEDEGGKDEDVFGPLFGAHGFEEGNQHRKSGKISGIIHPPGEEPNDKSDRSNKKFADEVHP